MATVTARGIAWTTATGAKSVSSFTPTAGDLIVCVAGQAGTDTAPTISDNDSGITSWTLVDSFRSYGSAITGGLRIYVAGQACSGSAMTVTMTPGASDTGGGLAVFSVSDPAAYGASAVRSTGGQADIASGTPAPVLSNTPLSKNPCLIAVMTNTNGSANASPRSSPAYSEAYDQGFNTPPSGLEVQFVNSSETSATLTTGGAAASAFASIGVEFNTIAVFTRSAAIAITPSVTSARIVESLRSASVTLTPDLVAAGTVEHVHSRSASVTITPDVASDGEVEAGAFDPTSITGLYAWYDADQLGLANNDPVTSWTDESGGARHATGAAAPLYKTGIQNGLPGLLFDGTDDTLAMTFSADTSRTFFVVAKSLVSTAGIRAVIGGSASRSLVQVSGAWVWRTNQAGTGASLGGTSTNTTVLSGVLTDATSMSWYLDTGSATSFDPDNTVTTGTGWTIGSYAAGQFWSGYIFEIVIYDSALGTTDRESVRDYLISKWTAAAPTVHERSASITITPAVASAGHEGFLASDIPGLECWLKADAIGLSDGANVTTWEDSHTSNKDATSSTGQTYETNEINGLDVVRFDGVDDRLSVAIGNNDATRTVFMVCRIIAGNATDDSLWGWGSNSAVTTSTTGQPRYRRNETPAVVTFPGTAGNGVPHLNVVRYNSTTSADLFLNTGSGDSTVNLNPHDGYQTNTVSTLEIAAYLPSGTAPAAVDVGEFLVYDSALATGDYEDVRDYLLDKWIPTPTVYERSASITITPAVASAQQNFSVLERSASVTLTPAVTSAPQTVHLRSASVTLTPAVASAATFFSYVERSAAIALTPAITTAPQRVLLRAASVTLTPDINATGQIEGGLVTHERSASITLTPALASNATFYSIIERAATVTLTPAIASAQMRVLLRSAAVTLTPSIASVGAIRQTFSRAATVTITPTISASGFSGVIFVTHPPTGGDVTELVRGGVFDETVSGGVVAEHVRGGVVVASSRGGVVEEDTHGATPVETLGGVFDETAAGGVVTTPTRGGVVTEYVRGGVLVGPNGGVVVEQQRGGSVTQPTRGGVLTEPKRGGVFDETSTGGSIA